MQNDLGEGNAPELLFRLGKNNTREVVVAQILHPIAEGHILRCTRSHSCTTDRRLEDRFLYLLLSTRWAHWLAAIFHHEPPIEQQAKKCI